MLPPASPSPSVRRSVPPLPHILPPAPLAPEVVDTPTPPLPLLSAATLSELPGVLNYLNPSIVRPFIATASRLAAAWLLDPTEHNLSTILALVKCGLVPALGLGNASTIARLAAYPRVSLPTPAPALPKPNDPLKSSISLLEAGFVGKAERALNDESRIAPLTPATLATLRAKHPQGEEDPFDLPLPGAALYPELPGEDVISRSISSFSLDTAPGHSGWSVNLLRLAAKSPTFVRFLYTLTAAIAAGTATGRSLLCAARLTPLLKSDNGIRPVAVGELFYRLAMKAIFMANFRKDFLSANQFGVGSKGGVEPIIQAVQQAAEGNPQYPFSHLYALDSVNAFNSLKRRGLAAAVRKHAPTLIRTAAWAHDFSAPLLVRSGTTVETILSSEGVRQGDPMSTLWFSLAIRDTVDSLQSLLGHEYLVLAYLDDIFVLAPGPEGYAQTLSHFDEAPVQLNPAKCKLYDLRVASDIPVRVLGSCVSNTAGRESFLLEKITALEDDLHSLRRLPAQHALLILRKSLQHKLRHLMRHLRSDDLPHLWRWLDASVWDAFDTIRGLIPHEASHKRDRDLISLPSALGGCGMFSHFDIAPLAFAAAQAASTATLSRLLPQLRPLDDVRSQRERSSEAFLIKQDLLMVSLDTRERVLVVEAASQAGRRWLDVIPSLSRFKISDSDVRVSLHYRTLHPGYLGPCRKCATPNLAAHDEACAGRLDYRIYRHETIKHALAAGLRMVPGVSVEVEPYLPDLRRRNDIRIRRDGDETHPALNEEYDLKLCVLSAPSHQRALAVAPSPSDSTLFKQTSDRMQTVLAYQARRKVLALPQPDPLLFAHPPFFPLVMSSGGMLERSMFEKLKQWRSLSSDAVSHMWMVSSMSVSLVKARGRTFMLS